MRRPPGDSRRFIPTCVGSAPGRSTPPTPSPVHPHVRGERTYTSRKAWSVGGSSPRAWGALPGVAGLGHRLRFIPTCVGSATSTWHPGAAQTVHPHVRGERVLALDHELVHVRFIPTCVGSAYPSTSARADTPVHPHVRGERASNFVAASTTAGSSPRAWGAHQGGRAGESVNRFIPTCVGSAHRVCVWLPRSAVHPHVRGERDEVVAIEREAAGSSPRAWGAPLAVLAGHEVVRFIPTCVGSAASPMPALMSASVHPHVRGERSAVGSRMWPVFGSSPRAWGARGLRAVGDVLVRFIPTCVGSAGAGPRASRGSPVHPHVRGERLSTVVFMG